MNLKEFVKLLRPKQWTKNVFVFAALIFSGNLMNLHLLYLNIEVFILFCLTSSIVYIINDMVDEKKDSLHPQKKLRPIASGSVSKKQAIFLGVILLVISVLGAASININVLLILLVYIILNIFYSFLLKNIVIIDVMILTFGFVLRVESGSVATSIRLSPWLILCTLLLSLFLAINKRKSEIIMLENKCGDHRKILEDYSLSFLDQMLSIVTPSILMAYCLYTFSSVQSKTMMITIAYVLYGIFRYQYLMGKNNIGSKPEDVFFKDIPFLINIFLWIITVVAIIYFKL